jgi:hypothetical protein
MLPKATISSDHNGIDNSVMMTGQPFIPRQKRKGRSCMQSKEDQISSSASSISINDGCMLQDVPINVGIDYVPNELESYVISTNALVMLTSLL